MRKTDLAYMAGILDGEGSIVIAKQKRIRKARYNKPYYRLHCAVSNTNEDVITLFWLTFGGSKSVRKQNGIRGKSPLYSWDAVCKVAFNCLEQLLPYLRIKQRQAQLGIEFQKRRHPMTGSKGRKTDEEWALDEANKILISKYNKLEA